MLIKKYSINKKIISYFFMAKLVFSTSFKKGLSIAIFSLIFIFFFGLVNIEHTSLGISEPLFLITEQIKTIFDIIFWIVIGLFALELVIAYLEIRNPRIFVRKNWLEIILLGLMFIFGGFEVLKISIVLIDQIKISKTGFKILKICIALIDQIKISKTEFNQFQKFKKSI